MAYTKEQQRARYLRIHHGLDIADYNRLLDAQGHACFRCRQPAKGAYLLWWYYAEDGTRVVQGAWCRPCFRKEEEALARSGRPVLQTPMAVPQEPATVLGPTLDDGADDDPVEEDEGSFPTTVWQTP